MSNIKTRPLAPDFGMEIEGIDFSKPLNSEDIAFIRQAWVDGNGVLLFRNQDITPDDHVRLTSYFGGVYDQGAAANPVLSHYYLDGYPQIYKVSNKKIDGKPLGREAVKRADEGFFGQAGGQGGGQTALPCDDGKAAHFGVRNERSEAERMKSVISRT